MCFQEGRLNRKRIENAHLAIQEKKPDKRGKSKTKAPLNQAIRALSSASLAKRKDT